MARVSQEDVRIILNTSLSDDAVYEYVSIANSIVTDELGGASMSEARLTLIEQWLTAHLIAITQERMGIKERLGEAEITYMGAFGKGLQSTPYGQTVAMLDTSSTLSSLGKKAIVFKAVTSFET